VKTLSEISATMINFRNSRWYRRSRDSTATSDCALCCCWYNS